MSTSASPTCCPSQAGRLVTGPRIGGRTSPTTPVSPAAGTSTLIGVASCGAGARASCACCGCRCRRRLHELPRRCRAVVLLLAERRLCACVGPCHACGGVGCGRVRPGERWQVLGVVGLLALRGERPLLEGGLGHDL